MGVASNSHAPAPGSMFHSVVSSGVAWTVAPCQGTPGCPGWARISAASDPLPPGSTGNEILSMALLKSTGDWLVFITESSNDTICGGLFTGSVALAGLLHGTL